MSTLYLEQYRACFEQSPVAFQIVKVSRDAEGAYAECLCLYANEALSKMLFQPLCLLIGKSIFSSNPVTRRMLDFYGDVAYYRGAPAAIVQRLDSCAKHVNLQCYQLALGYCACFFTDVTDQISAEKQLAAKQSELEAIIGSLPGGVFKYAAREDDQFVFVSENMLRMLGYTQEEFRAKFENRFSLMVYKEDRERVLREISEKVVKYGNFDDCEYRIETKSGALKWVYDVGHLVRDEKGDEWFYVVIVDTDERKRLEAQLKEATQRATSIVENTPGGIIRFDVNGDCVTTGYVSEGLCRLVGFTGEELRESGLSDASLVHPEDMERLRRAQRDSVQNGLPFCQQFRLRRKDGSYLWVSMNGNFVRQGVDTGWFYGSFADITEIKQLQQQASALMENTPGGIITYRVVDNAPRVAYMAENTARMLGYSQEELWVLRQADVYGLIHADDRERVIRSVTQALATFTAFRAQYRMRRKDGDYLWVSLIAQPARDADGNVMFYGSYTDITAVKQLEAKLENDKLEIENLVNSIPGGVASYLVKPEGFELVYCSDGMGELFGMTAEEYRERFAHGGSGVHPEDYERVRAFARRVVETNDDLEATHRILRKDGRAAWVTVHCRVVGTQNGYPLLHTVFHELSSETRRYHSILQTIPEAVIAGDAQTRLLNYANDAAMGIAGGICDDRTCHAYLMGRDTPCEGCPLVAGGGEITLSIHGKQYSERVRRQSENDAFVSLLTELR